MLLFVLSDFSTGNQKIFGEDSLGNKKAHWLSKCFIKWYNALFIKENNSPTNLNSISAIHSKYLNSDF